jgi:hypothetical protein
MHSHDRTLMARLGFSDPDKKDPRHDWACQYLCQIDRAEKIARAVQKRTREIDGIAYSLRCLEKVTTASEWAISKGQNQYRTTIGFIDVRVHYDAVYEAGLPDALASELCAIHAGGRFKDFFRYWNGRGYSSRPPWSAEYPLAFGEGSKIMGSLASHSGFVDVDFGGYRERVPRILAKPYSLCSHAIACVLLVEVKVAEVPVGDLLRQLNLYWEYRAFWGPQHARMVVATHYPISEHDDAFLKKENIKHFRLGVDFESYVAERERSVQEGKHADSLEV